MVDLSTLQPALALGPLDGRYRRQTAPLIDHLSEAALNRMRLHVEVEWLLHLTDARIFDGIEPLTDDERAGLRRIVTDFDGDDIAALAEIEKETVHDVKAVEYHLKKHLAQVLAGRGEEQVARTTELVHFACTSEDVNNLAYALMIQGSVQQVWLPAASGVVDQVAAMARELRDVPLLSRTHGQTATPSTMGKELAVLAHRLGRQVRRIEGAEYLGKINGAPGTATT